MGLSLREAYSTLAECVVVNEGIDAAFGPVAKALKEKLEAEQKRLKEIKSDGNINDFYFDEPVIILSGPKSIIDGFREDEFDKDKVNSIVKAVNSNDVEYCEKNNTDHWCTATIKSFKSMSNFILYTRNPEGVVSSCSGTYYKDTQIVANMVIGCYLKSVAKAIRALDREIKEH